MFVRKAAFLIPALTFLFFGLLLSEKSFGQEQQKLPWTSKKDTCRLVIQDLPTHCDKILQSQVFGDFFELMETELGEIPNGGLEKLKKDFNKGVRYVPNDIRISYDKNLHPWFGNTMAFFSTAALGGVQKFLGTEKSSEDVDELFVDFLKFVENSEMPGITITSTWADPKMAPELFEQIGDFGDLLFSMYGWDFQEKEGRYVIHGRLDQAIDLDLQLALRRFVRKKWLKKETSEKLKDWFHELEVDLTISQVGNSLVFNLGKNRELVSADIIEVPKLKAGESLLANGDFDLSSLKPSMDELRSFVEKWREREIGKLAEGAFATEDPLELSLLFADTLDDGWKRVTFHLFTASNRLEFSVSELGLEKVEPIQGSGILKYSPAFTRMFQISNRRNLGEAISDQLTNFENRLDQQTSKKGAAGGFAKVLSETYYREFREFRTIVHQELHKSFEPPFIGMLTPNQPLGMTLELESSELDFKKETAPGFAFVAKCKDIEKTEEILGELSTEFSIALFSALEVDTEKLVKGFFNTGDDVQGHTAYWLDLEYLNENGVNLKLNGDFHPHYFFKDNWVIFSTSKKASLEILNGKQRLSLQNPKVVEQLRLDGEGFSKILEVYVMVVNKFIPFDRLQGDPRIDRLSGLMNLLVEGPKLLKEVSWSTEFEDGKYQTKGGIFFQRLNQ